MNPLLTTIRHYWVFLTLITLLAITTLSLYPLQHLPPVPGSDKTHHFIAYGLLVLPTALRKPEHWQLISVFFIAWGGAIELVQPYVNRYGEWLDMAANTGGILGGIVIAYLISYIFASDSEPE